MISNQRETWHVYFMNIADQVATRSTCPRKKVGCVVVKNKAIIATGYNGSLPSQDHCMTDNCFIKNNHCIRTIHAETNAINQAAKNGVSLDGAAIYCNVEPCWYCYKNIISSGITQIYFKEPYGNKSDIYQSCIDKKIIQRYEIK